LRREGRLRQLHSSQHSHRPRFTATSRPRYPVAGPRFWNLRPRLATGVPPLHGNAGLIAARDASNSLKFYQSRLTVVAAGAVTPGSGREINDGRYHSRARRPIASAGQPACRASRIPLEVGFGFTGLQLHRIPGTPLLTAGSLVRVRPGEPNKIKELRPLHLLRDFPHFGIWVRHGYGKADGSTMTSYGSCSCSSTGEHLSQAPRFISCG
jgi:hypothetical protein